MHRILFFPLLIFLFSTPTFGQTIDALVQRNASGAVDTIERSSPSFAGADTEIVQWSFNVSRPGSSYTRVRLTKLDDDEKPTGTVFLIDGAGRIAEKITLADLPLNQPYWSDVIPGSSIALTLRGGSGPSDLKIKIDRVAYQVRSSAFLSTVGKDDKEPIGRYINDPIVWEVQKAVARLSLIKDGIATTCSGFLISSSALMTNHHCIQSQKECDDARVTFGVQEIGGANWGLGKQVRCAIYDVAKSDATLDYSIVELAENPGGEWSPVSLNNNALASAASPLFLVQHPGQNPKYISYEDCQADDVELTESVDFTHSCDTVTGSSGSPVFNHAGKIVGLHHFGFKDSDRWNRNRAVKIQAIISHAATSSQTP